MEQDTTNNTTTNTTKQEVLPYLTLNITPVAKPRMTQSDKWKKRKVVVKYWKFKDELKMLCALCSYLPPDDLQVEFIIPMPISWSKAKKERMDGKPHQQRPDLDNLLKALQDCLMIEDSSVHTYTNVKKVWGRVGQIKLWR